MEEKVVNVIDVNELGTIVGTPQPIDLSTLPIEKQCFLELLGEATERALDRGEHTVRVPSKKKVKALVRKRLLVDKQAQ